MWIIHILKYKRQSSCLSFPWAVLSDIIVYHCNGRLVTQHSRKHRSTVVDFPTWLHPCLWFFPLLYSVPCTVIQMSSVIPAVLMVEYKICLFMTCSVFPFTWKGWTVTSFSQPCCWVTPFCVFPAFHYNLLCDAYGILLFQNVTQLRRWQSALYSSSSVCMWLIEGGCIQYIQLPHSTSFCSPQLALYWWCQDVECAGMVK
jgi:hypothetical protein